MSAKDKFHDSVKHGLEKEGWKITHDPLQIEFGEEDKIGIDLGAERVLLRSCTNPISQCIQQHW